MQEGTYAGGNSDLKDFLTSSFQSSKPKWIHSNGMILKNFDEITHKTPHKPFFRKYRKFRKFFEI